MSFTFEWDDEKAAENLTKYGVSFSEASTVFADPLSLETRSGNSRRIGAVCQTQFISRTGRIAAGCC